MPRYLEKRRRRWYAVLDIPRDAQAVLGKPRFIKSLGTESLTEAERLVLSVVAQWKWEIETARRGISIPLELQAKLANEDYERADEDTKEILDLVLHDELERLYESNPSAADTYFHLRKGLSLNLREKIDEWLATVHNVPKTIDMKRSDVMRFVKTFPYSHLVQKKDVRHWAYELQHTSNLKPTTVRRIVSACRGYWKFLQRKNYIEREDDPFQEAVERRGARTKDKSEGGREHFTAEQVVTLLTTAKALKDEQLYDLITIGMWTGCRIEEICALELTSVMADRIEIKDAKSPAGKKIVPVHPKLAPTLNKLVTESKDGYVLSGLSQNKYTKKSGAVGSRFRRMKTRMGFGKQHVFHSIRKTVATLLENAGVPENIAADILGHEKKTITYGLYSGGTAFEAKMEAIKRIDYPL